MLVMILNQYEEHIADSRMLIQKILFSCQNKYIIPWLIKQVSNKPHYVC